MSGEPDKNVQTATVTETVTPTDTASTQETPPAPDTSPADNPTPPAPEAPAAPKKTKAQALLDLASTRGFNEGIQAAYDLIARDDTYTASFILALKRPEPEV